MLADIFSYLLTALAAVAGWILKSAISETIHALGWFPEKLLSALFLQIAGGIKIAVASVGERLTDLYFETKQKLLKDTAPEVENAPGLVWVKKPKGWEAQWQTSEKGYKFPRQRIWLGENPNDLDREFIASMTSALSADVRALRFAA